MTRQTFSIGKYWKVIIYYSIDYSLFSHIAEELADAGASIRDIKELYDMLRSGKAKAATYNSRDGHVSVVLFNVHEDRQDYVDSIVHEAEHVKQAMLRTYEVEDSGEPPAYTVGHIVGRMYPVFRQIVCNCPPYNGTGS